MVGDDHDHDELVAALKRAEEVGQQLLAENQEAQRQFVWAQQNRLGLLWVHGVIGLVVGPLMLTYGTAGSIETAVGIWSRTALGVAGVLGGALLVLGLTRRPLRSIPLEAAGLIVLALWDLAIAASFVAALIDSPPVAAPPWHPIPPDAGKPYPIGLYLGILGLIALHLWTLRAFLTGPRHPGRQG